MVAGVLLLVKEEEKLQRREARRRAHYVVTHFLIRANGDIPFKLKAGV
jgi:hypothetical protein